MRTPHGLLLLAFVAAAAGCSISASSGSLSESSARSGGASSDSSGAASQSSTSSSGDEDEEYHEEVRDVAAAYVGSGESVAALLRALGDLARAHGITDWEVDRGTYVAVGEGLARAHVTEDTLDTFTAEVAGRDLARMEAIQEGYRTAAR
jgi:hypothetical protein